MKVDGCCALITGASSGIGREFARQLASRARCVVLVARRAPRLEELRSELRQHNPELSVPIHVADLTVRNELDELIDFLGREKIEIDFLINNAGLGDLGSFATSNVARTEQIILVNILALTTLTRRLLPGMIAKKRGAVLNVSSSAGFLPMADFSVYAASKAYVNSFTEALRIELRNSGVTVSALCPGPVQTEFSSVAQRPGHRRDRSPGFAYVSVERVVRAGIDAIEADRPVVIPGFLMKAGMILTRLTPMPLLRFFTSKRR